MIVGFLGEALRRRKEELFTGYDGVGNVLFVNTKKEIEILTEKSEKPTETEEIEKEPDGSADLSETADEAKPGEARGSTDSF